MQALSSPKPIIEVASIRPNLTGGRSGIRFALGSGRATATNVTLRYLIKWAYNVEDYQISGGPKWLASAAFDITAKLAHDTDPNGSAYQRAYFREMIQPLLADRFKLSFQRTTKELPVYVLVVGKHGPKLKELEKPDNTQDMRMSGGSGLMVGQRIPITILTEALMSVVGRPVRDETGLNGYYDFRLQWDPTDSIPLPDGNNANAPISTDQGSPSIFTALQEQLGLRLESRKGPVDVLVIGRAELPSEN